MMDTGEAATALGALAQEKRLELLRLLLAAGPVGAAPGDLAAQLDMPNSTLSFHLAALERAALTQSSRQGRQVTHAIRVAGLQKLMGFLTETCCAGHPELCFATHVPAPPEETKGMTAAFNVLFLCAHNAARSIMAEAILAKIGSGRFKAYSAGADPAAEPLPEVIEKLRAIGHDVTGLHSKSWDLFVSAAAPRLDFVIALCDTLDNQVCPDFGEVAVTGAWPLPDPAKFDGSPAERSTMLNELYASLHRRLSIFTALPFAALDRMAMKSRLDALGGGGLPVIAGVH
jgi:protein-tyrosine-phosphatase/DNA-binding transcriptional ArsR family regulator